MFFITAANVIINVTITFVGVIIVVDVVLKFSVLVLFFLCFGTLFDGRILLDGRINVTN